MLTTEVGDRWAPGLDSWCLSSGVRLKLCSHPDTPRTKLVAEAELYWSKEIRYLLLRSRKSSLLHMCRKAPWRSKGEGVPSHSKCRHIPMGGGIHLSKKLHKHLGEDPRTSQVDMKKEMFLLIREDVHILSLQVCISALLQSFFFFLINFDF